MHRPAFPPHLSLISASLDSADLPTPASPRSSLPAYDITREPSTASTSRVVHIILDDAHSQVLHSVSPSWPPTPGRVVSSPIELGNVTQSNDGEEFAYPPLPRYTKDEEDPSPAYDRVNRNPDTLAKHLFRLGFSECHLPLDSLTALASARHTCSDRYFFFFFVVCPLFWLLSLFIISSPLQPPSPMDQSFVDREVKTQAERDEELAIMRAVELQWARRSLVALGLFCVFLSTVITVWISLTRSSSHTASRADLIALGVRLEEANDVASS